MGMPHRLVAAVMSTPPNATLLTHLDSSRLTLPTPTSLSPSAAKRASATAAVGDDDAAVFFSLWQGSSAHGNAASSSSLLSSLRQKHGSQVNSPLLFTSATPSAFGMHVGVVREVTPTSGKLETVVGSGKVR